MKNEITIDGKTYILKEESTKEFNGLICKPIEQFNTAFKNIKIPYGWRIPTIMEAVDLINNEDFVKWSKFDDEKHDFFIEQPFNKKKGKFAAGVYYNNGEFLVSANEGGRCESKFELV